MSTSPARLGSTEEAKTSVNPETASDIGLMGWDWNVCAA